jgi:hypothetical protein
MAEPRYDQALKKFIRDWRPNDPELDTRFVEAVRELLAAILKPPANVFDVATILSPTGGKVVVRLGDYEAQMDPLDAQHLALSLLEASAAGRLESFLCRFLLDRLALDQEHMGRMIAEFRHYRIEEMERELAGDFARRGVIPEEMNRKAE